MSQGTYKLHGIITLAPDCESPVREFPYADAAVCRRVFKAMLGLAAGNYLRFFPSPVYLIDCCCGGDDFALELADWFGADELDFLFP